MSTVYSAVLPPILMVFFLFYIRSKCVTHWFFLLFLRFAGKRWQEITGTALLRFLRAHKTVLWCRSFSASIYYWPLCNYFDVNISAQHLVFSKLLVAQMMICNIDIKYRSNLKRILMKCLIISKLNWSYFALLILLSGNSWGGKMYGG